jgi:HK97 family phage prohead protease
MATAAELVPNINTLHPALDGEGLLLEGFASTPALDRHGDKVNPAGLERSVKSFLATNPVLLWHHKLSLPPIGKVLDAQVVEGKGLWVRAVMPRPEAPSFAAEVYAAARDGLLRALSLGAKWKRRDRGTHREVVEADVYELSLCPVAVNPETVANSIRPTEAKALSNGEWISVAEYQRTLAGWLNALDRIDVQLTAAALRL